MNSLAAPAGPHLNTCHLKGQFYEEVELRFSPDDTLLAQVAPLDGAVSIWEVTTAKCVFQIELEPGYRVAFSARSGLLAACGERGGGVWELPTGHCICSYAWPDAADGERPETVA